MSATTWPSRLTRSERASPGRRLRGLVRGNAADAVWIRPALIALLAVTAIAYTVDLTASGYANSFYAAAVEAGTKSWKALFFGSLDSSSFITVDKPPASLWVMALSGRIFGFSSASMLIPEVAEGLIAVALLYGAVKRAFSAEAGLLAGLLLALTPVAALMFRFNNPDALMVCLNVISAYCLVRALEKGQTKWMVLCGIALGFAFLTKMMAGWLVVPGFAFVYLVAAPVSLRRRLWQLILGGVAMVVSCGWWLAAVALWPTASRPMIDGSPDNNIFNLIFGYNGFGRLSGDEMGGGGAATGAAKGGLRALGGAGKSFGGSGSLPGSGALAGGARHAISGGPGGGGGVGGSFGGSTGPLRLFNDLMGAQASWLIPAAAIAFVAGIWWTRRAPRTDRRRANLLIWGSWLFVMGVTFSFSSGIIHTYYTVALVPAIAALAAIGAVTLWQRRAEVAVKALATTTLLVTAGWAIVLLSRDSSWNPWLMPVIGAAAVGAAVLLWLPLRFRTAANSAVKRVTLVLAAIACLAGPLAYTGSTLATPHTGTIPTAGPASDGGTSGSTPVNASGEATRAATAGVSSGGPGDVTVSSALEKALERNASHYTWVAATSGSQSAAQLELATGGDPVMAIGGFDGEGGNISLATFKQDVADGKIHYYVVSSGGLGGGGFGGQGTAGAASHSSGGSSSRVGSGGGSSRASGNGGVSSLFGGSSASSGGGRGFPGAGGSGAPGGSGTTGGGTAGGSSSDSSILAWVKAHFRKETIGGQTVYNLTESK